jgi:hypothetical protein
MVVGTALGGFTWEKVDPGLIEALLLAKASRTNRTATRAKLLLAPDRANAAREAARNVFGQAAFGRMRPVVPVLRDAWLGRSRTKLAGVIQSISRDVEEQIGRAGTDQTAASLDTRRQFLLGLRPGDPGWSTF